MGSTKHSPLCNGFIAVDSAALVPVTLVLPVILNNNMNYTTCTLTDQSSSSPVGSTKLSPLFNGFITGDTSSTVSPTEQINSLPVQYYDCVTGNSLLLVKLILCHYLY